jgi:sugar O-acyltransferase (sialic acid O-acetyltransferase NeuD family)
VSSIKHKVILQGGGDHARVVLDALQDLGADVAGIFDPKYKGELFGVKQLGAYQPAFHPEALAVIAIGDNAIRKRVAEATRHGYTQVFHPSASISRRTTVGTGTMILHHAVVQANTKIGDHVILNTGVRVDHDCDLESYVHVAPGAGLCGTVTVGDGTFIGAGAIVIPGIRIGKWATIGAGSVVIRDIPDFAVAVGNPAKVIKQQQR